MRKKDEFVLRGIEKYRKHEAYIPALRTSKQKLWKGSTYYIHKWDKEEKINKN